MNICLKCPDFSRKHLHANDVGNETLVYGEMLIKTSLKVDVNQPG